MKIAFTAVVAALVVFVSACAGFNPAQAQPLPERCDGYISAAFARTFAEDWIASWNSHDMNRVLANYTDDFEMSSPFIIVSMVGDPSGTLKGKAKVAAYWQKGIAAQKFVLIDVFAGAHSVAIHYTRLNAPEGSPTRIAVETEEFNSECKVFRSNALYGGRQ